MKKKIAILLLMSIVIGCLIVFSRIEQPILVSAIIEDNAVDSDSNIDSINNIGSNSSSFVNAQIKDNTFQNITEELQSYQENTSVGFTSGLHINKTILANRKACCFFNFPSESTFQILSARMHVYENISLPVNITMGIYNSSAKTGNNNHPTDLLASTNEIQLTDYTDGWYNASFPSYVTLPTGQYWLTVHTSSKIEIRRSSLVQFNTNKSCIDQDDYYDGLEDPAGDASGGFTGAAFFMQAYINRSINSYMLEWEHQVQNVNTTADYHKVCIYGYANDSEIIDVEVWDPVDLEWDHWTNWEINSTPGWFNFSLFQHINSVITYRFSDTTKYDDSSPTKLIIDYSGIFIYDFDLTVIETTLHLENPYNPGDGYVGIAENPIHITIDSGIIYGIQARGGVSGYEWIYISNTTDTSEAIALHWFTLRQILSNQEAGITTHTFYIWVNIPPPSVWGDYNGEYEVTLLFGLTID